MTITLANLQRELHEGGYASLAQAALAVQVPLTTLASAVKQERIPSLRMPDRRYYVQINDVRAYFAHRHTDKHELLASLAATRLLILPKNTTKLKRIKPLKISGKPVSQTLIEERGRL